MDWKYTMNDSTKKTTTDNTTKNDNYINAEFKGNIMIQYNYIYKELKARTMFGIVLFW